MLRIAPRLMGPSISYMLLMADPFACWSHWCEKTGEQRNVRRIQYEKTLAPAKGGPEMQIVCEASALVYMFTFSSAPK
jgi:hypothetical protein